MALLADTLDLKYQGLSQSGMPLVVASPAPTQEFGHINVQGREQRVPPLESSSLHVAHQRCQEAPKQSLSYEDKSMHAPKTTFLSP